MLYEIQAHLLISIVSTAHPYS